MARNNGIFTIIFASFMLVILTIRCDISSNERTQSILDINHPNELSDELRNFLFYLYKTGDFGSTVIVQDLEMNNKHQYKNERRIFSVDVSSDGRYLVYTQPNMINGIWTDGLWLVDLEDGISEKIAGWREDITDLTINTPSFSPESDFILFSVSWLERGKNGLVRVNLDGNRVDVLDTTKRLLIGPESSPNGSLIIVQCSGYEEEINRVGLCLLDDKGKFIKYLVDNECFYSKSYFFPDGQSVIFGEYYSLFSLNSKYSNKFFVMDIYTEEKKLLLTWDIVVLGFSEYGEEVVFIGNPVWKSQNHLYIINKDGTNLRHLAYYDDFLEEWYADADD